MLPADLLVLSLKTIDPARGVEQLLTAGKKGMAAGTDFHANVALVGGAGLESVPACADYVDFAVRGMNVGFHGEISV
jgi:hypothetical protein